MLKLNTFIALALQMTTLDCRRHTAYFRFGNETASTATSETRVVPISEPPSWQLPEVLTQASNTSDLCLAIVDNPDNAAPITVFAIRKLLKYFQFRSPSETVLTFVPQNIINSSIECTSVLANIDRYNCSYYASTLAFKLVYKDRNSTRGDFVTFDDLRGQFIVKATPKKEYRILDVVYFIAKKYSTEGNLTLNQKRAVSLVFESLGRAFAEISCNLRNHN